MKQRILLVAAFAMVFLAMTAVTATAAEPETHSHFSDGWPYLDTFKNPADGVEFGLDVRVREVFGPRLDTIDQAPADGKSSRWHFQRYRMRLWNKLMLDDNIDVNTRLVWEFRTWDEPARKPQSTDFDEILLDRLNITIREAFDLPLTVVVGRQDIIMGQGWLVLDGTPLDGSRTIFFDAVRATLDIDDIDSVLDVMYINNDSELDNRLKAVNDRDRALTEQDEQGWIVELRNKSFENTDLAGYFIYKRDKNVMFPKYSGLPSVWSKDAEIYTFGGRANGGLDENWKYYGEAAFQFGKKNDVTMKTYGANSRLTYQFNDKLNNSLHAGYEYLSGDDPGTTGTNEQFDPLWGEWPQWSELYPYLYGRETMPGETTNLRRVNVGHNFVPAPKWSISTDYNLLWADENTLSGKSTPLAFSDSGKFRGQLATLWLKWQCCPRFKAHFLTEYFVPSDYYAKKNRDAAWFLRFNVEYTF